MKIAFIDYYSAFSSDSKEPISIPLLLQANGIDVTLVNLSNLPCIDLYGIKVVSLKGWLDDNFVNDPPDQVVIFSRFDHHFTYLFKLIKELSIPIVLKGDTDGTLGYPLLPNYLRSVPIYKNPLNIWRQCKWRLPLPYFVKQKINQIKLADLVVCESPMARANIIAILEYWGEHDQIPKICFIPNLVSDKFMTSALSKKIDGVVMAYGRWDDVYIKGTDLLVKTIANVVRSRPRVRFVIAGNGSNKALKKLPRSLRNNVKALGHLAPVSLLEYLETAQVVLITSRVESFCFSAAEALCTGSSLVATPIESLIYLSGSGGFGSISTGFNSGSLTSALLYELDEWSCGNRNSRVIAEYWRGMLGKTRVETMWLKCISSLNN